MAAQSSGSAFPDTAAVPLADGGADNCPEKEGQTGKTVGILCLIFVQNRENFPINSVFFLGQISII